MMQLHSKIMGAGRPLLILHGFLGMGDNWKTLGLKFAEQGYEVHLIDQRNHGRSFHHPAFSYQDMSADLHQYCLHYRLNNVIVLGHSMGGKTAMTFACTHRDICAALIVADIGPKAYPQHHQSILKGLMVLSTTKLVARQQADELLAVYVADPGVRQFLLKNLYWVSTGVLGLRVNVPVLAAQAVAIGESLEENRRFDGPTLFLKGIQSDYIDLSDLWLMQHHFPKAILRQIERAGHWLHAENPQDFLTAVCAFLRD
jgi:esterase